MIKTITKLFPVWAILFTIIAFIYPSQFADMKSAIVPLLTIVMFGMGITLTWENFIEVFREPRLILLGVILQYTIMPAGAYSPGWQ